MAARGALWLSLSSWTAKGAQTAVLLVLAKALTPSEFGVLAVAALTYNILLALNQMGVGDALTYLADRIEQAARTALSIVIMAGLVLMSITWLTAPLIAHFFHISNATFVLRGFALAIPFDAVAQVPIGRLTRTLKFARRTLTDAVPSVVGAAITIGVVAAGHPLIGLVVGQIVGSITNAVLAMIIGPRCLPGWNSTLARRMLKYGGFLAGADILNLGLLNVDYIVVGHVIGPTALGLYSLAYRICFMPYLSISVVANGAVFPYYCRLPSREAKARTAENTIFLITAISIPWFTGLILFAGDIALLGYKWSPAAPAVRWLAVYGIFLSLILSALQVLKAIGKSNLVFFSRAFHLITLVILLVVTARYGITVVALDQALISAGIFLAAAWWMIRYASLRAAALARSIAMPLLGSLGMVLAVLLFRRIPALDSTPSWTSLLVLGSLGLAAFAVIMFTVMPEPIRKGWAAVRGREYADTPGELSLIGRSIRLIRPFR